MCVYSTWEDVVYYVTQTCIVLMLCSCRQDVLDDADDWEKAVVALIIIAWIVAFFNLLVDFGFLTLALLWSPTEPDAVGDVTNAPFYLVLLSLHTDCEMVF